MTNDISRPEQRIEPRLKVRLAIYFFSEEQELMTDYSVNMSAGGIFIETDKILPIDTELKVEFTLPVYHELIQCKARVAWINEEGARKVAQLPAGMGLQFIDLSLENIRNIRRFLSMSEISPTW